MKYSRFLCNFITEPNDSHDYKKVRIWLQKKFKTDKNVRKNLGHPKHPQKFSLFDELKKGYLTYK